MDKKINIIKKLSWKADLVNTISSVDIDTNKNLVLN